MKSEFKIINRIKKLTGKPSGGLVLGIGDDCAVTRQTPGFEQLVTTDMLVEGVHFRSSQGLPAIGYKAMAANISDIHACGGVPECAFLSVGLPKKNSDSSALLLYKGIKDCADRFGVQLAGGDTVRSRELVISIALTGRVRRGKAVLRSGAGPTDLILVTGDLGNGAAALKENAAYLPPLRGDLVKVLADRRLITSMIDISDGLSSELFHLCEESGTGAVIYEELIPVSKRALVACGRDRQKALKMAFYGGEDYELLFTASPSRIGEVLTLGRKFSRLSVIGRMACKAGEISVVSNGRARPLPRGGYDAFI